MSEMEDTKRFSSEPASYLTAPNYLTASNQKDLTTEKKEFDPSPEITSKAFPKYQYGQFNVSEEERKDLWDKTKEEYGAHSWKQGSQFQTQLAELEKSKLDNKLDHISAIVGEPVENIGFGIEDQWLNFKLSRGAYFVNRKKKFEEAYPNGVYQQVEINVGENQTEKLEIFKKNKDEKGWKISNPYGRDWNEIGKVAGMILNEQLLGETAALLPEMIKKRTGALGWVLMGAEKIPAPIRVMLGNFFGKKGQKFNEWMAGFGESEFAGAEKYSDIDWSQFFLDKSDWAEAAVTGVAYKGMNELMNYLIKGKRPGMVEMSESIIRASEELGIEPLILAQLVTNPIVRRMYEQSGLFVSKPGVTLNKQVDVLIQSLKKFGIGNKDGQLTYKELVDLQDHLALDIGNKLKMWNDEFPTLKGQMDSLDQAVNQFFVVANKTSKSFMNDALELSGDASTFGKNAAYVNLRSFQSEITSELNKFFAKASGDKNVMDAAGNIIIKNVKKKYGTIPQELLEIKKTIDLMIKPPPGSNQTPGVISAVKEGFNGNLKTLYLMRNKLHKLTQSSDADVSTAAQALHKKLLEVLDPSTTKINGSGDFLVQIDKLNSHLLGVENVKNLTFAKEALGGAADPDSFVAQFMKPNNTLKLAQLKNMLFEGAGTKGEKAASESAWNVLRKTWFNRMIHSGDVEDLNKWIVNDPDGLKLLLGEDFMPKIKDMKNMISLQDKLENGIVAQYLKGGELYPEEAALEIINKGLSKDPGKGFGLELDKLIADSGGFNSTIVSSIREQIIKNMLKNSSTIVEKGKKALQNTIDPKILRQEIRQIQNSPWLMKFFDEDMITSLQNYNLYTTALAGQSDVGGMIAAGALSNKATDSIFKPVEMAKIGFTLLKHEIVARLLRNKMTSSVLKNLDVDNVLSPQNITKINLALTEMLKETTGEVYDLGQPDDFGVLKEFKKQEAGANIDTDSGMAPTPEITFNRPNGASRMAKAPVVNPAGMFGTPTGRADADTYAQGQQLFGNNPREITFANQGGIMSTNRAFQRVA